MAALFAIVYPDQQTAKRAMETAHGLQDAGYLEIKEQALVYKNDQGNVDVDDELHPVRRGAVAGGVVGAAIGLMFFAPFAAAAAGATLGAILSRDRSGASDAFDGFRDTVSRELPNGGAAVILFGETDATDRVRQSLGTYGGKVFSYDISKHDLAELQLQIDKLSKSSQ